MEISRPKPALGGSATPKSKLAQWAVIGVIVLLVVNSCMKDKQPATQKSQAATSSSSVAVAEVPAEANCTPGTPLTSPTLDVTGFDHPVYSLPDIKSEKVLNKKGSDALKTPLYRQASVETRVQPFCESGEWRKIRFMEPAWPETGWVKADILLPPRADGVPRVYTAADVQLDDKRMEPNRALLVKAVNRIHAEDSRCKVISPIVFYAHNKSGKVDTGRYFVMCGAGVNATNVRFTLADVKSPKKFSNPMDSAVDTSTALSLCRETVRRSAKFPSSVDFDFLGSNAQTYRDGTTVAQLDFEAKNGFGNLIPQRAVCRFPIKGEPSINIGNR